MNKVSFGIRFCLLQSRFIMFLLSETVVTLELGVETSESLVKNDLGLGMFSWM